MNLNNREAQNYASSNLQLKSAERLLHFHLGRPTIRIQCSSSSAAITQFILETERGLQRNIPIACRRGCKKAASQRLRFAKERRRRERSVGESDIFVVKNIRSPCRKGQAIFPLNTLIHPSRTALAAA